MTIESSSASGCDELAVVHQVPRRQGVHRLVDLDGHLKFNALPHWQPVELSQYWRDMLAPANASNEARGSIFNSLKTLMRRSVTLDNSELQ